MSKLNATDIQGFVLRGYNLPVARYLFLHFEDATKARSLIGRLLHKVTTGQHWDDGKPQSTVNIAFTHRGLVALDLPDATLLTFPVEFQQGMKKRAAILGDTGANSPEHWDECWRTDRVHAWVGINAQSPEALDAECARGDGVRRGDRWRNLARIAGRRRCQSSMASRPLANTSASPTALAIRTTWAWSEVRSPGKAS